MLRKICSAALMFACLLGTGGTALAAKTRKKTRSSQGMATRASHEVYSSIDTNPAHQPDFMEVRGPEDVQIPSQLNPARPRLPLPAPQTVSAKTAALDARKGKYDSVPAEQAQAIAKRLKLVERLIVEYGRAYDYRIHTNQELETILANLDAANAASKPRKLTPSDDSSNGDAGENDELFHI